MLKNIRFTNSLDQRFPNFFFHGAFFWTKFSHGSLAVNNIKYRKKILITAFIDFNKN
jgi:hypothetical protein